MARPNLTPQNLEEGPAVIRPLSSLTSAQADAVDRAMAALSTPWRVERHDDYDGYLSIVVSPDDPEAPAFAISGTVSRIDLSEVRDDQLLAHGQFTSIEEAVAALIKLQGQCR